MLGLVHASLVLRRHGIDHVVVSAYPVTTDGYWNTAIAKHILGYIDAVKYGSIKLREQHKRIMRVANHKYEGFLVPMSYVFGTNNAITAWKKTGLNKSPDSSLSKKVKLFLERGHLFLTQSGPEAGLSTPGIVQDRLSTAFFYPRWNTICFPCLGSDFSVSEPPKLSVVEHEVEHALHYAETGFNDTLPIQDAKNYDEYGVSYYLDATEVRARTHEFVSALRDFLDKQRSEYQDNIDMMLDPNTSKPVRAMARRAKDRQEKWFGKVFGSSYPEFQAQLLRTSYNQGPLLVFVHSPNVSVFIEHLLDALREPASTRTEIQEQALRYVSPRLRDLYSDLKKQYSRVLPKSIINHTPSIFRQGSKP